MPHKCDGCFWKTDWEDVNGSYPICERLYVYSFEEAKEECTKSKQCDCYITQEKANKIIDKFCEEANKIVDKLYELPN